MTIFIGLLALLFLILALIRLDWAILLLVASLPAYLLRLNIGPIPSTLLELMILIVFAVWFFKNKPWQIFKDKNWRAKKRQYPFNWEIILILITAWLALATAAFTSSSLGVFKAYFLEPIMLYIVIINVFHQKSYRSLIWALGLSAIAISGFAIFQQFTGLFINNEFWAIAEQRRVVSVFQYPNAVGLYLAPIIMLLGGLFLSYPKRTNLMGAIKKILILLIASGSLLAIYFSRSKGALIGLAVATIVSLFFWHKKGRVAAIILIVIIASSLYLMPTWRETAIKTIGLQDLSGQIRKQQWKETWEMLTDGRIITGSGLSNYQITVAPFHQEGIFVKNDDPDWHRLTVWNEEYRDSVWQPLEIYLYPHNIFLNFWTELGLIGALLFTWLIGRYFFLIWKLKRIANNQGKRLESGLLIGLLGAMITIVIHGLVDVPYFKNDLSILFWLLIALLGIIKLRLTSEQKK